MARIERRLLLASLAAGFLSWTAPCAAGAQEADGPATIAVFPYFSPDPAIAEGFAYALYAVPDLLRERLMADPRFAVAGRAAVDAAIAAEGFKADAAAVDAGRQAVARRCGADYFIWGYILRSGEGLRVFHALVEVETGRTLHLVNRVLPEGPELIDAMSDSVLALHDWTKAGLEPLHRPERIVEKTVVVEKTLVVKETQTLVRKVGLSLSPSISYLLFPWSFSADLRPVPAAGLEVSWTPGNGSPFDAGLDLQFSTLRNKDGAGISAIDVIMLPVLAEAGLRWMPSERFGLRAAAAGGFSLIFGRVNAILMDYPRPLISARVDAEWQPSQGFSARAGARLYYGFGFYSDQDMLFLAPEAAVAFHL